MKVHVFGLASTRTYSFGFFGVSLPESAMRSAVTKRDCDPLYRTRAYLNTLRVVCAQQPSVFVEHCLAAGNLARNKQCVCERV